MGTSLSDMASEEENNRWAQGFWAERQEEADYLGIDIYDYMSQVEGGMLSGVMHKLKLHAEAHPLECPPGCEFQTSLERLKEKYRREDDKGQAT
jgi:hypothetical protein